MMRIKIVWKKGSISGELNDSAAAIKIANALPFSASANTWGKEVYFDAPVSDTLASDATDVVPPGTICFWVEGSSVAIPFGPTPVSRGNECRLVTRVNIVGRLLGDPQSLETITDRDSIRIESD